MIALDPEFVGSLALPSKLTTDTTSIPFARLPRIQRLKVSGKADETEEVESDVEGDHGKKESRKEREKRKMRGKGKSLKRYLRKQRKNVIDPTVVSRYTSRCIRNLTIVIRVGGYPGQTGETKRREATRSRRPNGERQTFCVGSV